MSAAMNEHEAILRRLRELLVQKRETLNGYLVLLEQQGSDLEEHDVGRLEHHVALETEVLKDLSAIQRAVVPMQELGASLGVAPPAEMGTLESSLEELQARVSDRQNANRELLSTHMADLESRIERVAVPPQARNVYGSAAESASLIDISL